MSKFVKIKARRDGYALPQVGYTMTVQELIDHLKAFDPCLPVYVSNDNGYTFGSISENEICWDEIAEVSDLRPREIAAKIVENMLDDCYCGDSYGNSLVFMEDVLEIINEISNFEIDTDPALFWIHENQEEIVKCLGFMGHEAEFHNHGSYSHDCFKVYHNVEG